MRTIHVNTGRPYDIFIERGIIDNCGEYVKNFHRHKRLLLSPTPTLLLTTNGKFLTRLKAQVFR